MSKMMKGEVGMKRESYLHTKESQRREKEPLRKLWKLNSYRYGVYMNYEFSPSRAALRRFVFIRSISKA